MDSEAEERCCTTTCHQRILAVPTAAMIPIDARTYPIQIGIRSSVEISPARRISTWTLGLPMLGSDGETWPWPGFKCLLSTFQLAVGCKEPHGDWLCGQRHYRRRRGRHWDDEGEINNSSNISLPLPSEAGPPSGLLVWYVPGACSSLSGTGENGIRCAGLARVGMQHASS